MVKKQLNNQEQIFVDEYLVSLNPEKAALAAKYAATTARTKAYQWVSNSEQNPKPYIYQAIQKKMAAQSEKTGIKAERVVEELARIGFANIRDVFAPGNKIRDVSMLPPEVTAAVESVTTSKTGTKVTMQNKLKALENLGKHLGIYNVDNEQKKTNLADFLRGYKDE
ncbi:MAG: terminase small subunit [Phycisphaerae bacterium]|nr:terminase small subunit [Phycisphaerae bacterium]